jgi:exodeoxyribonuclease VII large subunit
MPQLHPDKPLERGFARVTDPDGLTLTNRKDAGRERALVLRFWDGDLPVAVGSGPAKKSRPAADAPRQPDLF